jgi:phosphatidate cytidylyltransferase
MSDDLWRRDDEWERKPLFADDNDGNNGNNGNDDHLSGEVPGVGEEPTITFEGGDTGELPHWTEPPTGEMPIIDPVVIEEIDEGELDEELDVWSTFASDDAVWGDDAAEADSSEMTTIRATPAGVSEVVDEIEAEGRAPRQGRITIGTDPSGIQRRPVSDRVVRQAATTGGRNLPIAIAVGVGLAAVFVATIVWRPAAVLVFVTLLLGLAAVEFYDKVGEKGYRPAVIPGIVACLAAPLAAYWVGPAALPLVIVFALIVVGSSFIGAGSVDSGPLPNTSITMLGVVWIGLMGSFAALILQFTTTLPGGPPFGTDTLLLLAVGVVFNDIGAYLVGSAVGRTALRPWISPSKTVEGLIGGALFTIVALVVIGISGRSDTWTSTGHLLLLAIVISIFAPLGDLVESMFKRNLDIKDFGTLIRGHGGVLDRFDGFLFTLPAVYYLTLVLEPWGV